MPMQSKRLLRLKKETVRELTGGELSQVVGGTGATCGPGGEPSQACDTVNDEACAPVSISIGVPTGSGC